MIKFIDRTKEISSLKNWCSRFRYSPLYIYGPEGCGKTRLLREFVKRFNDYFDGIAIYIDAMESRDIKRALMSSKISEAVDLLKISSEAISGIAGVPIGQALSRSISIILDKLSTHISERGLEGKNILVAVDDVTRAIGLDKVEWYVKWLFELMNKLNEDYRPKAINFIVTTSEGVSRKLISRHRSAEVLLMWNMEREGFRDLFYELNPPNNMSFDRVWNLFGGNPGKLIELAYRYEWKLSTMLKIYEARIRELVKRIIRRGLIKELREFVDNILDAENSTDERMELLENMLEEENLVLYKRWPLLTYEVFDNAYPEMGIGKSYAWQVPMYKDLIRNIISSS